MSENSKKKKKKKKKKKTTRGPEVIQIVLRSRLELGRDWTILPCSSVTKRKRKSIFLHRIYELPRDDERTCVKGWIQSTAKFGPVSDKKVCSRNGRYSVEVQVQSLFQDQTVSWIRIVNGIDKFVREAMPIQEEEKPSVNPLQKRDQYFNRHQQVVGASFLLDRENGLTLKHRNQMILVVFMCRNSCLDYYDTVKKFIEKMMEQSNMTQLSMNARESNSTILKIDQLRWRRT